MVGTFDAVTFDLAFAKRTAPMNACVAKNVCNPDAIAKRDEIETQDTYTQRLCVGDLITGSYRVPEVHVHLFNISAAINLGANILSARKIANIND
jgi:hypothetical protein